MHACGLNFSILYRSLFRCGIELNTPDTLNTERAFLDDSSLSDGHIRIQLLLHGLWNLRSEPVVDPDLIGTGTATEACSNAPVIDLGIQALQRVIGREYRANRLTRSLGAMLTQHWHEARL